MNRDVNACKNIRDIAHEWIFNQTRPDAFSRSSNSDPDLICDSKSRVKRGQSVVFTEGNTSILSCTNMPTNSKGLGVAF